MEHIQNRAPTFDSRGTREFASARDGWLVAVLIISAIFMTAAAVFLMFTRPAPTWLALFAAILFLAGAVLIIWMVSATTYHISDSDLWIRCGPFRSRLALDAIDEITPTRNPLSSPALSLNRLRLTTRGAKVGVMVSPADRDGFLDCLLSHTHHLRRDGDYLRRVL